MFSAAAGLANKAKEAVVGGGDAKVLPAEADAEAQPEEPGKPAGSVVGKVANMSSGAVGTVVGGAAHLATGAAGAAQGAAGVAVGAASDAAGAALTAAGGAADVAFERVAAIALDSKERMQNLVQQLKDYLEAWIKSKIQAKTEYLVEKLPGIIMHVLEDPEMPRCVSRGKDRLVMSLWPDVREEIMWEVAVLLDGEKHDPEQYEMERRGVDCFRAFFRYHIMPYDHSIWGQIRDPVFWILKLIALIPVYGVSPGFFLFVFLIIDKSEEFQLINFILGFKGTQFLSQGVIKSLTGFSHFMLCVTAGGKHNEHSCEDNGPGTRGDMMATAGGYVIQIILVWVAFFLLRCSVEKGRTALRGSISHEHGGMSTSKGGYIAYFLWYDLFCFFFALILPVYALFTRPKIKHDDWVVAQTVYAAQVIYGLLSAPFFLFTLPGLQVVLTHSYPTAYDRKGRCRPPIPFSPPKEETKPPEKADIVSEEETTTLIKKMRELIGLELASPRDKAC